MRATLLALPVALLALPALAEGPATTVTDDPPLTAEEFDALTRGKTMDTHDALSGLYGVETFLSGRRVVWKDAEGCMNGTWEQVGEQICFMYDGKPNDPVCWTYHDRGTWIEGFFRGDRQMVPIMLYPGGVPVSCGEYLGA
ncbi:hypothetical protein [Neotabrizicola sp. VNH66]|uniref:hypothetical protein n=1 Tax=Neotabrizicola sp. VNH66 TaxID=3400918 RepID=UPI003BFE8BE0